MRCYIENPLCVFHWLGIMVLENSYPEFTELGIKTTRYPYLGAAERAARRSDRRLHRPGKRLLRIQVPGEQAFRLRPPGSPLPRLALTSLLTPPSCCNQRPVQRALGARIRDTTSTSAQKNRPVHSAEQLLKSRGSF